MINIVVVGAGIHSLQNHLPALKRYVSLKPDEVKLTALCDLRLDHVDAVCKEYGFERYYLDIDEMLIAESPDGCIAVTPISETKRIVSQIIPSGVPLLMEKPPGATFEEAKDICAMARRAQARVMVSMNRRFSPVLSATCSYVLDRPLEYLRGVMLRHKRMEPGFFFGTAIHAIDAMRHIAGDVRDHSVTTRKVDGVWWYNVHLTFESGTHGILEVMPNCGCVSEYYEIFGPGYRILADIMEEDLSEPICWDNGRIVQSEEPTKRMPDFIRNGTYGETVEFISSLKDNRAPRSSIEDILQSVELCHRIQESVNLSKT